MEFTATKTGFGHRREVSALCDVARENFNGRAWRGLWTSKLEFGAEIVRAHPAHAGVVDKSYPAWTADQLGENNKIEDELSGRRRCFDLNTSVRDYSDKAIVVSKDVSVWLESGESNRFAVEHKTVFRVRNMDFHSIFFVHKGHGFFWTDFGKMTYKTGDFISIPQGTTYAMFSDFAGGVSSVLEYRFSKKIMKPCNYWIDGYPYSSSALKVPQPFDSGHMKFDPSDKNGKWRVYGRRFDGGLAYISYPFSPFDGIAWEGDLYPFILHTKDIRTLSSPDFHIDPKAFTIFVTEDESASMQIFLPRWVHSLPYPHQNNMDELLFNHEGYSARPDVKDGFATLHPAGIFHGPDIEIQNRENCRDLARSEWRDETAVMLESKSPLLIFPDARVLEVKGYEEGFGEKFKTLKTGVRNEQNNF